MKQLLLLSLFVCTSFLSLSQNYIYSFEGNLDQEQISRIEKELSTVVGVAFSKVKIKEGTNTGEVLITAVKQTERSEIQDQLSPVDIKRILISHQLTPNHFIESK